MNNKSKNNHLKYIRSKCAKLLTPVTQNKTINCIAPIFHVLDTPIEEIPEATKLKKK